WRKFTGQTFDEIKGWGWSEAVHPQDLEHTVKVWKKAVSQKRNYEVEYRIRRFDGIYRYFLARGIPVLGQNGEVEEWVGTCIDITNLKELDLRKDEFISIASHELKTPLTSIKTYGQIIQNLAIKQSFAKLIDLAKSMNRQVSVLQDYVNELLNVNKIQAGKLSLKKKKFDIYHLIKEECDNLQKTLPKHKLLTTSIHAKVNADKERIRQVLINLITNAAKYSPKGGKIIIRSQKKNNELIVSVKDFGVGVANSEQERIFERFYQAEGLNRDRFGGLGLGLFISKGIISRHKGQIWVESKKNRGATFFFTLPIIF
ncbi:PAS domain-containing sensor histidine kinase, partial [Candidatus Daviesbacteria bacterium]|nr:PAS domain-containing sensor histidine kinase [Candidatus Daviesbacteria bacterium]